MTAHPEIVGGGGVFVSRSWDFGSLRGFCHVYFPHYLIFQSGERKRLTKRVGFDKTARNDRIGVFVPV